MSTSIWLWNIHTDSQESAIQNKRVLRGKRKEKHENECPRK